jgi:hypothetical protein
VTLTIVCGRTGMAIAHFDPIPIKCFHRDEVPDHRKPDGDASRTTGYNLTALNANPAPTSPCRTADGWVRRPTAT